MTGLDIKLWTRDFKKRNEYNKLNIHIGFSIRLLINLHWISEYRQGSLGFSLNQQKQAAPEGSLLEQVMEGKQKHGMANVGKDLWGQSPLVRPALSSLPLNHIEYFQVWWFHHSPGQKIQMYETDLVCLKTHLFQVPIFVKWFPPSVLGSLYFDQKRAECFWHPTADSGSQVEGDMQPVITSFSQRFIYSLSLIKSGRTDYFCKYSLVGNAASRTEITSLLQRYQGEGQEIIISHSGDNGPLALSNKSKYYFFTRKKKEWKSLTELSGKGSSEHTHCSFVTKKLPPPHLPPAAMSDLSSKQSIALSRQDRDSSLQQINIS